MVLNICVLVGFCTPLFTASYLIACTLVDMSHCCHQWEHESGECEANNNGSNDDNNNEVITTSWDMLPQASITTASLDVGLQFSPYNKRKQLLASQLQTSSCTRSWKRPMNVDGEQYHWYCYHIGQVSWKVLLLQWHMYRIKKLCYQVQWNRRHK